MTMAEASTNPPDTCLEPTRLAQLLKAAADPLRLEILRALSTDSYGVLELCHAFGVKQSGMSHHLKVLAKAQLVTTRREGNTIFYRRNHIEAGDEFWTIKHALFESADQLDLSSTVTAAMAEIHRERAHASQVFFKQHAQQFKEQQDLIAAFDVYGPNVAELLESTALPDTARALEVGPGTGDFLQTLAQKFSGVVALDNSEAMLAQAKIACGDTVNIDFVCDDTRYCHTTDATFDCVIINMVLHHTPSPSQIFADVSLALKRGGALLVCDLCQHNQDWTRKACGDLWLGFEPDDLTQWASENTMTEGQSVYFALRNGFQIQIRQFFKH